MAVPGFREDVYEIVVIFEAYFDPRSESSVQLLYLTEVRCFALAVVRLAGFAVNVKTIEFMLVVIQAARQIGFNHRRPSQHQGKGIQVYGRVGRIHIHRSRDTSCGRVVSKQTKFDSGNAVSENQTHLATGLLRTYRIDLGNV